MSNHSKLPAAAAFSAGDPVTVLYQGRHNGWWGRFLGLRKDPHWANIAAGDGTVSGHPVAWLRHPASLPDDLLHSP